MTFSSRTYCIPKNLKTKLHRSYATVQRINRWSTFSHYTILIPKTYMKNISLTIWRKRRKKYINERKLKMIPIIMVIIKWKCSCRTLLRIYFQDFSYHSIFYLSKKYKLKINSSPINIVLTSRSESKISKYNYIFS